MQRYIRKLHVYISAEIHHQSVKFNKKQAKFSISRGNKIKE